MANTEINNDRIGRTLSIYNRLLDGEIINKAAEALAYDVNERTIQRDIDEIRNYLAADVNRSGYLSSIVFDRAKQGYRLERIYDIKLKNDEILALCKILLDSRAFTKQEMTSMLERLISCCAPAYDKELVRELIRNEAFHYVEPRHGSDFLETMWTLGMAIKNSRYVVVDYLRLKDKTVVQRKLKPAAIMFSEYYFYLTAFIDEADEARNDFDVLNDAFPMIYRIDRIRSLTMLDETFHIPYADRFEEGEFRKRVQFMYGGRLKRVKFRYTGPDIDAVLDRLPTAEVVEQDGTGYTVQAEVFGSGIDMWLRSQGDYIRLIE